MKKGIQERVGEERFRKLVETMTVPQMCVMLCTHHTKDELRADCQACRRAIYRGIEALKEKDQKDKSLDIIDRFEDIPEIQQFAEFLTAKGVTKRGVKRHLQKLALMWQWIRESENDVLMQNQRPALWDMEHVQYVLAKIRDKNVSMYTWIQTVRRLFEAQGRLEMLSNTLLRARRRDMRSPRGTRKKRVKDYATPQDFQKMLEACDTDLERLKLRIHVTLKCREGSYEELRQRGASFTGLRWERVNWEDTFYSLDANPKITISVFETKTGGGTQWEHCPLDLYWSSLPQEFKAYWESKGCPKEGFVWGDDDYEVYRKLFLRIREKTGLDLSPHDMRRTGASWLHDQGADNLAIGQYDPRTGRAVGFGGVGWENAEIYFQTYGRLSYDALKKLWKLVHQEVGLNGHI